MADKELTLLERLSKVQIELKVPKGQFNSFGRYKYRNAEDILEAVKPLLSQQGLALTISDELVLIGERFYIRATARIAYANDSVEVTGYAREEDTKKGMDGSQITGASSSYARKYALNGLFLIDDTKDSDTTNAGPTQATSNEAPKLDTVLVHPALLGELKQALVAAELGGSFVTSIIGKPVPRSNAEAQQVLDAVKALSIVVDSQ